MCAWFLEIVSSANIGVCVCLPLRALIRSHMIITSHIKGTHNNRIRQFYSFLFLCLTLVIGKLNGHGLSSTVCHS